MNDEVFKQVASVFRMVFKRPELLIRPEDTAADIAGWDSLTHMTLINELEIFFKITFTFEEVTSFKNTGDLVELVSKKIS
jgi:acyl carrier protein